MKPLVFLLLATLASACGTTTIISPDPYARIWVDGELVGQGQAQVRKRGFPGSATVKVQTEDGTTSQQTISRSFTLTTFALGLVTYYTCMFACWEYPDTVFVRLRGPADEPRSRKVDRWSLPPAGWAALPGSAEPRPPSEDGCRDEGARPPTSPPAGALPPAQPRLHDGEPGGNSS